MDDFVRQYPYAFPVFFVAMWLVTTTILGGLSGWYLLMRRYPDRNEKALLTLSRQSGSMGLGVSMRGILHVSVCPSGLRVGIMKIFGVFCRDFFVPWEEISIERKKGFFWKTVLLRFGNPTVGRLRLFAHAADRLARASAGYWPEAGPFPEETPKEAFVSIGKEWLASTILAAAFFTIAPRILAPDSDFPPLAVAILFPAIVFGIVSVIRYCIRVRR